MKKLFAILMLTAAMQAGALELDGVKFEDNVQVGNAPLLLNGAGVRSVMFFDTYAAGLYLPGKKDSAEAVMADTGAKRIVLHVLREGEIKHFTEAIGKGMAKNRSEQEQAALRERLDAFNHLFDGIKMVKKDEQIVFDWLPGDGTHVSLGGKELGKVAGEDFYRALLAVWIGDKPAKDKLKKELLGAR